MNAWRITLRLAMRIALVSFALGLAFGIQLQEEAEHRAAMKSALGQVDCLRRAPRPVHARTSISKSAPAAAQKWNERTQIRIDLDDLATGVVDRLRIEGGI